MFSARTLKTLALLLAGYVLLALPAYLGPAVLEEISSYLVMPPLLSIYLFHTLGIPGLVQQGGACGWGMCAPTAWGWAFVALFWLGVAWILAWGLARLSGRRRVD
jgi:hypothetical protein